MADPRAVARRRRPMLLALVYGVFLVLVGVTASGLVAIASFHVTKATVDAVVRRDASLVALFVNGNVRAEDLDGSGPTPDRAALLEERLATLAADDDILRIELRAVDGSVLVAVPPPSKRVAPVGAEMATALGGEPSAVLTESVAAAEPELLPADVRNVVQEFLPVTDADGRVLAVAAVWRDAAPILASIDAATRDIVLLTLAAAVVLAAILFLIFRAAQARLVRQQRQLVEAERRDALTGLLNHGAIVGLLAESIETARGAGSSIGLALVDLDNFRLLNETHGHDAGDDVLLRVAALVEREAGEGGQVARYGPDEFLVVAPGRDVPALEATVTRIREELGNVALQFGDSERLPVTVSAGICAFPEHAASITELLTAAAVAASEAKASGGDGMRVARIGPEEARTPSDGFDVLQGLVIAVDTKDRYTKRHSEDVARYAVFLAERLGLDEETRETLHLAGLLHDVGKIGIPDTILRKPAKLTADEYEAFKQHVALGDAIVRDVPNVELVRAGIRHHHERWDGRGYLEGLEGEEIPLIGRILAVADAFSAMTTTRPYRKALPVEEALKRLGDAADNQLEEELVKAFIEGIETAPDAPMPGEAPPRIWQPIRKVA